MTSHAPLIKAHSVGDNNLWTIRRPLTPFFQLETDFLFPRAVCELSDGRVATGAGKMVCVWDGHSGARGCVYFDGGGLHGHAGEVLDVSEPNAGYLASASADGTARIWDITDGTRLCTLGVHGTGHGGAVNRVVAFRGFGCNYMTASDDGFIIAWDSAHKLRQILAHGGDEVKSVCVLDKRRVATASYDSVRVWDVENKVCERTFAGFFGAYTLLADGLLLCSQEARESSWSFYALNIDTGSSLPVSNLRGAHLLCLTHACAMRGGFVALALTHPNSSQGFGLVCDAATGEGLHELGLEEVQALSAGPDFLVAVTNSKLHFFDIDDFRRRSD